MSAGGLILATTALGAVNQIGQGYAERSEYNYNASVVESRKSIIQAQAEIDYAQYQRMKGKSISTSMANIAGAGIEPVGSAAAVMVNTVKNITIDQAISQFNYKADKRYAESEAEAYRRRGRMSVRRGWVNALSTGLEGGTKYAMYKGFNLS